MSYKISEGIDESQLKDWLANALQKYGTYQDGAIDYTHASTAPIVMCTVICGDEIFLAKRGHGLADAEGMWSTVNGFIDEHKPVKEFAKQECKEELNIDVDLSDIFVGKSYTLENPAEKRKYIVFPCLVNLASKPTIKLGHEHTDYAWIKRSELDSYGILDDLPYAVDSALKLKGL